MPQSEPYHQLIADLRVDLGRAISERIAHAIATFVQTAHYEYHLRGQMHTDVTELIAQAREIHEKSCHGSDTPLFTHRQEAVIARIAMNTIEAHVDALHREDEYEGDPEEIELAATIDFLTRLESLLPDLHRLTPERRRAAAEIIISKLKQ